MNAFGVHGTTHPRPTMLTDRKFSEPLRPAPHRNRTAQPARSLSSDQALTPRSHPMARIKMLYVAESSAPPLAKGITTSAEAAEAIRAHIPMADNREYFIALLLNSRHIVVSAVTISVGTLNTSLVHPREVFRAAIVASAAAIILGHNHPSGDPTPSPEDVTITTRLRAAGRIVGISLLDHIIVTPTTFTSLRDRHPRSF